MRLRKQLERPTVARPNRTKVPPIGRRDLLDANPLGHRDDRCGNESDLEIGVLAHDFGGTCHVLRLEWLDGEFTARDVLDESLLRFQSDALVQQVSHLRQNRDGNNNRARRRWPPLDNPRMPTVVCVDQRIEGAGVSQDYSCGVRQSNSSTRLAVSVVALEKRPAIDGIAPGCGSAR